MSILINKNTKVITQGITGKTGQFHTRMCRDYANGRAAFVAGVNPKKAGEDFEGIPIFANVTAAATTPSGATGVARVNVEGALVGGTAKRIDVCTSCLKAGKVTKPGKATARS